MATVAAPAGADRAAVDPVGARRDLVRAAARRSLVRRRLLGRGAVVLCMAAVAVSLAPLVAMVAYTTARGVHALSVSFLTSSQPAGLPDSGIANAIVGTLILVAVASAIAIPVGIMAAMFLLEQRGRLAAGLRFTVDVLAGVPSIALGIFVYVTFVEPIGHFSGLSGSVALATLMLPIVIRASEAAMRSVPRDLWEAGLALGARRGRVVRSVVLRGALPGLVTGNLLAVARAAGETAALLFTAFGSELFGVNPLQPLANMPQTILSDGTSAFHTEQLAAWGTAIVLLALVLALSIIARIVAGYLNRQAR